MSTDLDPHHPARAGGQVKVPFTVPCAGRGPLTWGQQAIWSVLRRLPDDDHSMNLRRTCPVPTAVSWEQLRDAVRALIERHESLRTVFVRHGQTLVQRVLPEGTLDITVHEAGTGQIDDLARTVGDGLWSRPFAFSSDLPLRIAAIVADGAPVRLVLVASHLAIDGWSFRIVLRDLAALLEGRAPAPRALQPLERARYESSPEGLTRNQTTQQFIQRNLRGLPSSMLTLAADTEPEWPQIRSRALAAAVAALAEQCQVSASTAMLACTAWLLAAYKRESAVLLRILVATRFSNSTRDYVGAFNQNAFFRVELIDEPFTSYVQRVSDTVLRAYRNCECDPAQTDALVEAMLLDEGITAPGYCFFNDTSRPAQRLQNPAVPSGRELAQLGRFTQVEQLEVVRRPTASNFFLFIRELDHDAVVSLCATPRFLAPGTPVGFLEDLETLAVRAASLDMPASGGFLHDL